MSAPVTALDKLRALYAALNAQPGSWQRLAAELLAPAIRQLEAARLVEGTLVRDKSTGVVGEYLGATATIRTGWTVLGRNTASIEAVCDPDDLEPAEPGAAMGQVSERSASGWR